MTEQNQNGYRVCRHRQPSVYSLLGLCDRKEGREGGREKRERKGKKDRKEQYLQCLQKCCLTNMCLPSVYSLLYT